MLRLWNTATHALIGRPVQAGTSRVRALAFSRDGNTIAATGQDSYVRAWAVPGLTPIAQWSASPPATADAGNLTALNRLAFGPGGMLISAANDGTAQVWNISPAVAVRRVCTAIGRAALARDWRGLQPSPGPDPCPPR